MSRWRHERRRWQEASLLRAGHASAHGHVPKRVIPIAWVARRPAVLVLKEAFAARHTRIRRVAVLIAVLALGRARWARGAVAKAVLRQSLAPSPRRGRRRRWRGRRQARRRRRDVDERTRIVFARARRLLLLLELRMGRVVTRVAMTRVVPFQNLSRLQCIVCGPRRRRKGRSPCRKAEEEGLAHSTGEGCCQENPGILRPEAPRRRRTPEASAGGPNRARRAARSVRRRRISFWRF